MFSNELPKSFDNYISGVLLQHPAKVVNYLGRQKNNLKKMLRSVDFFKIILVMYC